MRQLLGAAEWGAREGETSEEFQARERWESALDSLATLDFEGREVEFAEALGSLERIASETVFAPESRSAPVQVMGPMEAAGSEFEAIWFLRGGELSWPPVAASLPLLPWSLQRELAMPGTDARRDAEAAERVTRRILGSGSEIVVSYAEAAGEARQRESGIFREMGLERVAIGELAGTEAARRLVEVERVQEPGLPPFPARPVSGGARVLQLQAACGFRAFAEQRLWSSEPGSRELGPNAKEKGNAVHRALESFWNEVRSQAGLRAMSVEERQKAISRAIDVGLASSGAMAADGWGEAYLLVQRERLRRLLNEWLRLEDSRPPFEVLRTEERLGEVQVGPLRLHLRMDRVDLVDGMEVLIDYKTGLSKPAAWMGERPDEPQLPLYAILAARGAKAVAAGADPASSEAEKAAGKRAELGAVAFASVRTGTEMRLQGLASRGELLPDRSAKMDAGSFEGQVERWGEVLERLAAEFAAGDAAVRPKNYPKTCANCHQRILCRLDASLLEEMEEDWSREGGGEDG